MREIKFRGKKLKNGEWVYGTPFQADNRVFIITSIIENSGLCCEEVHPDTVGQYTGQNAACKDAQGQICRKQQVFEHDILADQNGEIIGCVKFTDESGWMVGVESLYDYTDRYDEKEALIIGNIHDNPELLKGGEE